MTTATASPALRTTRSARPDPFGRRYGRMWRRVPRELGYLALTAAIGLVVYNVALAVLGRGVGVLLSLVSLLLLIGLLLASRYLGRFELHRLRWARTPAIAAPSWPRPFAGKRPLRAVGDVVAGGHYWLYGLHSLLVNPLLAGVTFTVWLGWLGASLGLLTSPVWSRVITFPVDGRRVWIAGGDGGAPFVANGRSLGDSLVWFLTHRDDPVVTAWWLAGCTAIGALMLALLPFITRGMTMAHWGAGRLLLSRFPSEGLRDDVLRADAARLAAVTAEDTALRRLERDIHDGPQQRLLRLQMELATAERRIQGSPAAADSIATARRLATETLDELRALAQGFAPPLLQDRGLSAALGALSRRGAVPVETAIALTGDVPDAVERSVYFIAAELTANAIKHGGASAVRLEAGTADAAQGRVLRLVVHDDGRGGAHVVPGHGLAGALERLTGLGGSMTVTSPAGGPTAVEVQVPLP